MANTKTPFFGWVAVLLALIVLINPITNINILAFLALVFLLLHAVFKEYTILILLAIRPAIDQWRDLTLVSYQNFNININAALAIILLCWAVMFIFQNAEYWKKIPLKFWWLTFVAWCALSLIWSFDRSSTVIETIKALDLFALFGVSFILHSKYQEKYAYWLHTTLFAAAIVPIIMALVQLFTRAGIDIDGIPNRIYGTFAHPNIMATFALLIFMAITDRYLLHIHNRPLFQAENSWLNKIFVQRSHVLIGTLFLLAIVVAFTYTRIAWVGLALFLIVLGVIYWPKLLIKIAIGVGVFYLLFYPLNNFLIDQFNVNLQTNSLVSRLTTRNQEADSIQWRADVANKVLPLYWEHPIIGYGYGAFAKVWDDNKPIHNIWDNTSEAHNDYLKVGFETGIIGLILFVGIYWTLFLKQVRIGWKNGWINIVFISSILVYLALSVSDNMLHHTPVIWWIWAMWGFWSSKTNT